MWSRTLLTARQWQPMQKRGMAAIRNWKRPTMDEFPAPTMPYKQAVEQTNKNNNMMLVAGTAALVGSVFVGFSSGLFTLRFTPTELLPK